MAEEGDADALVELEQKVDEVGRTLDELELRQMLGGEHDAGNAIVEIHPGAGGLEAQDWAEMLLRMYLRWCERRGYRTELVEQQPGEGAGIKSATVSVEGPYAYGYLKAESGRAPAGAHLARSTPTPAARRRSPRCSSTRTSRRTSRSRSATTTCASTPIARAAPAASTSTRPTRPSA